MAKLAIAVPWLTLCFVHAQVEYDLEITSSSNLDLEKAAEYACVFRSMWTASRHPNGYPGDPHWSSPVLLGHSDGYKMWGPGLLATAGVERVAEIGSTGTLISEIATAGSDAGSPVTGRTIFVSSESSQTLPPVRVDSSRPFLSSITMIADSPDWFSGFYDVDLRNSEEWVGSFVVKSYPWDAGTEDGEDYDLNNAASNPQEEIHQLSIGNLPSSGVFADPTGTTVLPVAEWECQLLTEQPSETPSALPTKKPSSSPTSSPSGSPSVTPTVSPSDYPTLYPSESPSRMATSLPSSAPTEPPSNFPTQFPTENLPSIPTFSPSDRSADVATGTPSHIPTVAPSSAPSSATGVSPVTLEAPTSAPSTADLLASASFSSTASATSWLKVWSLAFLLILC